MSLSCVFVGEVKERFDRYLIKKAAVPHPPPPCCVAQLSRERVQLLAPAIQARFTLTVWITNNTAAPFLFVSPCTCGCDSMMIYGSEQLVWLWWYICWKTTLFCHIICGLDFNIPTVHESLYYHFGTSKKGILIFFTLAKCSYFLQGNV